MTLLDSARRAPVTSVGRISAPKAADVLADELRRRIRSGEWPEGLALPTERMLSAETGLSRTSVREALRMLEIDGLLEIRPGRGGGARVRRPRGDELTRQLELFIWGRNIAVEHLHDVRIALEALGAEGAARQRSEVELEDLVAKTEAVETAVDDLKRYLDANLAWHMAVVRASHNDLLIGVMDVLSNAIHQATEIEAFQSQEVREATLKIHRAVLQAIDAKDADAARRRMTRHVSAAREVALRQSAMAKDQHAHPARSKRASGKRKVAAASIQRHRSGTPKSGRSEAK